MSSQDLCLGDLEICAIVEADVAPAIPSFRPTEFFPGIDPAVVDSHRHWLEPRFLAPETDTLRLRIQTFVVRTGDRNLLVDTCVGNHKPRPSHPFWDRLDEPTYERNLAIAGLRPEDIDVVVCTHLHMDHIGWNTRRVAGHWEPTFPNATYYFETNELSHALHQAELKPGAHPWILDSVVPVVEAGAARAVAADERLDDDVTLVPAAGHTVGHVAVRVSRGGPAALFVGDLLHSPLQLARPDLAMRADHDPVQARLSRERVLEQACDTDTVVLPAHVPLGQAGRIERAATGYRFRPVDA
jgi:glyoxylase-like metal-dependent hydrolase (beta-lactamase superfamily II)